MQVLVENYNFSMIVLADRVFAQFPLDSPYITMVKNARINNKCLSPSTICVWRNTGPFCRPTDIPVLVFWCSLSWLSRKGWTFACELCHPHAMDTSDSPLVQHHLASWWSALHPSLFDPLTWIWDRVRNTVCDWCAKTLQLGKTIVSVVWYKALLTLENYSNFKQGHHSRSVNSCIQVF